MNSDSFTFDCVVSITVHEEVLCVKDLIDNIFTLCKMKTAVVLHCNDYMYDICNAHFKEIKNVFVNPIHWNKETEPIALIKSHLENFNLMNKEYKFEYFIWLASNCLFVKPFTLENIKNKEMYTLEIEKNYSTWHFPCFFKRDKHIMDILKDNQIEIIGREHEGAVMTYEQMVKISDFVYKHQFDKTGAVGISCLEEVIVPSLEKHFSETNEIYRINKAFWRVMNCTPSVSQIEHILSINPKIYTVKRVPRKYDNAVRSFYRQKYGY
jgi:hypothetical protein